MEQKAILVYVKNLISLPVILQKGAVFHVPQISLIQPTCPILKLTKQRGSTCPSPPKNR